MLMTFSPLDDVRKELKSVDKKIADLLSNFRANADPEKITPTTDLISKVQLPTEIENLAINTNTPRELFAGVTLFLALTLKEGKMLSSRKCDHGQDKTQEFIALCDEICERHDLSRQVFEHKKICADDFRENDGKIITFIPKQHDAVVARMANFSLQQGYDYYLSANIIGWIAAVNAGWEDMGINENKGPFVKPVTTDSQHELRDPRPLKVA